MTSVLETAQLHSELGQGRGPYSEPDIVSAFRELKNQEARVNVCAEIMTIHNIWQVPNTQKKN